MTTYEAPDTGEPDEEMLPPKPEEPLPSDEEAAAEPGDEEVPEEEILSPEQAQGSATVDDQENDKG